VGGAVGWVTATVGVQLALALLGAAYEHVAETSDALDYPPPGQLMDIGGYRLHLLYVGSGTPTVVLEAAQVSATQRRADVLLGDIDVRGARGRQGTNLLLASALTGWRIRVREIARSPAWRMLEAARQDHRSVPAVVQARVPKGLAVVTYGLHGLLPTGKVRGVRRRTPRTEVDALLRARLGQELQVNVLRLDPDTGHIFVSERIPAGYQLPLL
jgi:hypothetical protein